MTSSLSLEEKENEWLPKKEKTHVPVSRAPVPTRRGAVQKVHTLRNHSGIIKAVTTSWFICPIVGHHLSGNHPSLLV